ncbi:MAG: glycosyltransferase family 2 protein [Anaerolineales bacterium]|jgi:glycosyltransferase involved in cell wall biosynthesis|nr:glycosyltransferase family 2 protein [Anaerolineales bacterium]
MDVSVIIPAINEERSLEHVLAAIPGDVVTEIILVDGGSTDSTVSVAKRAGAMVVYEPRRGYGLACATGVEQASGEVVVFMDADGADDPAQIHDIIFPLQGGEVDMVLGSRLAGNITPGAMPWHQRFGNWLSAALIRGLYGLKITDLSPFRAVRRGKLLELDMQEMTYGWPTEMITKGARQGWRIVEIPVNYHPRLAGESKISGTFHGTLWATYYILRTIFRYVRA